MKSATQREEVIKNEIQWKGVVGSDGEYHRGFTGNDFMIIWLSFWVIAPFVILVFLFLKPLPA